MGNRMSQQTRLKIIDSFFHLLEQKSYEEITVVDIVEQAGCSRKTFYRAFSDKSALLNQYLNKIMDDWIAYAQQAAPSSIAELVDLLFMFWQRYNERLSIIVNADLSAVVLNKFNQIFPDYFVEFHHNHQYLFKTKLLDNRQLKYSALLRLGGLWNVYAQWLQFPDELTFDELRQMVKKDFED